MVASPPWFLVPVFLLMSPLLEPSVQQAPATSAITQTGFGNIMISVQPSTWLNYSTNATVTFTFSPPCPNITVYTKTRSGKEICALGGGIPCPNPVPKFLPSQQTIDPAGAWIRVANVTTLTNGYYYAKCSLTGVFYQSSTQTDVNNLVIGVNPRVVKLIAKQPSPNSSILVLFGFTRVPGSNSKLDRFVLNSPLPLISFNSISLAFGVGKGYSPDVVDSLQPWSASSTNFSFLVPEFDQPNANSSFVRRSLGTSVAMTDVTPYGEWYTYVVTRAGLAAAKTCSLDGRAVATLVGAPSQDIVNFHADFLYPLTIGSITVDHIPGCSCLFTCNVMACPTATPQRFEWAFFDNSSISQITYLPGNVDTRIDQFILNSTQCQAKFKLARRQQTSYNVRCRVYSANDPFTQLSASGAAADFATSLYEVLRPCTENEFQCSTSLSCIPLSRRCNGVANCADGSDERNCAVGTCKIGQYMCPESRECIESYQICDSVADCQDQYDERNCTVAKTPCASGYFRCNNRKCTRGIHVCDGDEDCGDGSDEARCGSLSSPSHCRIGEFVCSNAQCVQRVNLCDGINNCGDNSDEDSCGTYYSPLCGVDYWQCGNNRCVLPTDLCDGENDCGDDSDEAGCGSPFASNVNTTAPPIRPTIVTACTMNQFTCNNGRCIEMRDVCDLKNDCGDNSEEGNSTCAICPGRRYHCRNNKCINPAYLCDGDNDCGDGTDEMPELCSQCSLTRDMFRCKVSSKCIYLGRVCDGSPDCGSLSSLDNSDESPEACMALQNRQAAVPFSCPPLTIKCTSSNLCVPQINVCNGAPDCCPKPTIGNPPPENDTHIGNCEKTDEIGCDRILSCSERNGGCMGRCISLALFPEPNSCGGFNALGEAAYCACDSGYLRPVGNYSACFDIDECSSPFLNNCSQICTNKIGSYNCTCYSGFVKASTNDTSGLCSVANTTTDIPADPMILFVYDDSIRLWKKNRSSILVQTDLDKTFTALDVDLRDGTVIYAKSGETSPKRTSFPINGQQPNSLSLTTTIPYAQIVDLSVDFVANNLYVADVDSVMHSRIMVSLIDGRYQKLLLSTNLQITSLATNPFLGTMYYATYSLNSLFSSSMATVIMTSMTGDQNSNVEIFRSTKLGFSVPTIAVDYLAGGRLYFYDGTKIYLANYDGSNNATFTVNLFAPSQRAFDVFGNMLYGFFALSGIYQADSPLMLYAADKFSRQITLNLTTNMINVANVRTYHPLKAGPKSTWPNPCPVLKCSHLCLLDRNGKAVCACPDNRDQQNCTATKLPEPDHPVTCTKYCTIGQGICAKDLHQEAFVCVCNRFFSGRFCNESLVPISTVISPTRTTSAVTRYSIATRLIPSSTPASTAIPTVGTTVQAAAQSTMAGSAVKEATTTKSAESSRDGLVGAVVALAVILGLIIIAIVLIGICFWRRRARASAQFGMHPLSSMD